MPYKKLSRDAKFWPGRRRPTTVLPVGDSITAGGSGSNQYPAGYAELSIRLAGRMVQIGNAGVAGNTSTQILARFQTDVIDRAPDAILLMAGTNDFVSGMTTTAIQTCMNNIENMVLRCFDAGILPILVTPPPKSTAPLDVQNIQRFYYDLAEFYSLPLVDIYHALVDATNGNLPAGVSADGVHPNAAGTAIMAALVKDCLRDPDGWQNQSYRAAVSATAANSAWNLIRNGSASQRASAPQPDGWTLNTTNATYTTDLAAAPYSGREFAYVKSVAGSAYAASMGTSTVVPGNVLRMTGSVEATGTLTSGFSVGAAFSAGGNFRPLHNWTVAGNFDFAAECIVPAGATAAYPQVYVVDAATYKVRNLTLVDMTAQRAIWQPGQQGI